MSDLKARLRKALRAVEDAEDRLRRAEHKAGRAASDVKAALRELDDAETHILWG